MTDFKTVALRVLISFDGLTAGDVIHVPDPVDAYYQNRIDMGLLAPAWPDPDGEIFGTVLSVDERGETTTVLGVMPPRKRRTRAERAAEAEATADGETDSESA